MEKSFVARNLRKSISYVNIRKNKDLHTEAKRQIFAKKAANLVDENTIFENSLNSLTLKGKQAFTINDTSKNLVLNLLSRNIKTSYNILVKSREEITATLIAFLKESSPYHIHRFDVKSFYESFDRSKIISKLKKDGIISKKNIDLLVLFFKELEDNDIIGLPRGLGLSATLSELMMKEFDKLKKNMAGVFYYARFVDDMILITDNKLSKPHVIAEIENSVPDKLEIHKRGKKIFFGRLTKAKKQGEYTQCKFSYLGYKYTSQTILSEKDSFIEIPRRSVLVDISDDKVKKIQNKLIRSFTSYITSKRSSEDYELLVNRLKFLTGNYNLVNTSNINNIKSGIYYNYNLINQDNQLKKLDNFMRGLLFSKKHKLSSRIQIKIPLSKRKDLSHFSFQVGHSKKRFFKFTYKNFMQIKRTWL